MKKKMKMLMVTLGLAAIMAGSFATVAMAAGPAGYGTGTQDCIQQTDCLQTCDTLTADQLQDRVQLRDRLQDCDSVLDAVQDRIQQRDQLRDPTLK